MMSTSLQSEDSVSKGISGSKIAALEETTSAAPPEKALNNVQERSARTWSCCSAVI